MVQVIRKSASLNVASAAAAIDRDQICEEIAAVLRRTFFLVVGQSEEVKITVIHGEKTSVFKVDVSRENLGRVLGAKGKTIAAIRQTVSAMVGIYNFRAVVEVPFYAKD